MSIKIKFIGSFLILFAVTLIIGFIGIRITDKLGSHIVEIADNQLPRVTHLAIIKQCVMELVMTQRSLLAQGLTPEHKAKLLDGVKGIRERNDATLQEYEKLLTDDVEKRLWEEYKAISAERRKANNVFFGLVKELDKPDADKADIYAKMTHQGLVAYESILNNSLRVLQQLIEHNTRQAETVRNAAFSEITTSDRMAYLGLILGVILAVSLGAVMTVNITRPISSINQTARAVADGDFSKRLDISRRDEFGQMAQSLNRAFHNVIEKNYWYEQLLDAIPFPISVTDTSGNWTFINKAAARLAGVRREDVLGKPCAGRDVQGRKSDTCGLTALAGRDYQVDKAELFDQSGARTGLVEVIQDVTDANALKCQAETALKQGIVQAADRLEGVVGVITSATDDLENKIGESSRGAEIQSQRVAEAATAMEEMTATVVEVAKSAARASDISTDARRKAEQGADLVSGVVRSIGVVQDKAMALKTDMAGLGKQAEGIGRIMEVISDIADQTNLLALNAAIEAARAGEAGRGFAVVADEVRKLAEKTMSATRDVGSAIQGIQDGTRRNIGNVEGAVTAIEQATDQANLSGSSLKEIVALVEMTADQVRSIATASEEQAAASEEINRSVEDVNRISADNSEAMRQAADTVTALADQTRELRGLIEHMRG